MTICAVVETLRAGYVCEEEMVKSLGFKVGDKFELECIDMGGMRLPTNKRQLD